MVTKQELEYLLANDRDSFIQALPKIMKLAAQKKEIDFAFLQKKLTDKELIKPLEIAITEEFVETKGRNDDLFGIAISFIKETGHPILLSQFVESFGNTNDQNFIEIIRSPNATAMKNEKGYQKYIVKTYLDLQQIKNLEVKKFAEKLIDDVSFTSNEVGDYLLGLLEKPLYTKSVIDFCEKAKWHNIKPAIRVLYRLVHMNITDMGLSKSEIDNSHETCMKRAYELVQNNRAGYLEDVVDFFDMDWKIKVTNLIFPRLVTLNGISSVLWKIDERINMHSKDVIDVKELQEFLTKALQEEGQKDIILKIVINFIFHYENHFTVETTKEEKELLYWSVKLYNKLNNPMLINAILSEVLRHEWNEEQEKEVIQVIDTHTAYALAGTYCGCKPDISYNKELITYYAKKIWEKMQQKENLPDISQLYKLLKHNGLENLFETDERYKTAVSEFLQETVEKELAKSEQDKELNSIKEKLAL